MASYAAAAVAALVGAFAADEIKAQLGAAQPQQLAACACALAVACVVYRRLTAPPAFVRGEVGEPRKPCGGEAATIAALPALVDEVRATFKQGVTRPYAWRIQQLRGLQALVEENSDEIFEGRRADSGKSNYEWFFEKKGTLGDCAMAISQLSEWMKPKGTTTPFWMQPASSYTQHEPLGTVLVVAPWNYPITLSLHPLIGAFAAGNTAVLKPSELAPHQSTVLAKLLARYIDSSALLVVEGGVEVSKTLLTLPYDFVFYTGGPVVGSLVAQTCSKSLTPFCLELGGKSPTIVDENVDLSVACARISQGKFANAGQTCIAPDYVLVHAAIKDRFVAMIKTKIEQQFGADPSQSPCYGRMINEHHWGRVNDLKDGVPKAQLLHGGENDSKTRYIAPTLIDVSKKDLSTPLMNDEIFGPLLPILSVDSMEEAIAFVNARPKPLSAYVFSSDNATINAVLDRTTSGSACVNDCVFQYLNSHLPFGGVGSSGMGAYHGYASFTEFSHSKSVLAHSTFTDHIPPYHLRYAPHPEKQWVQGLFGLLMDI